MSRKRDKDVIKREHGEKGQGIAIWGWLVVLVAASIVPTVL